jgi:hypothetical protein
MCTPPEAARLRKTPVGLAPRPLKKPSIFHHFWWFNNKKDIISTVFKKEYNYLVKVLNYTVVAKINLQVSRFFLC